MANGIIGQPLPLILLAYATELQLSRVAACVNVGGGNYETRPHYMHVYTAGSFVRSATFPDANGSWAYVVNNPVIVSSIQSAAQAKVTAQTATVAETLIASLPSAGALDASYQ